jgi:hypothetical protein
MNVYITIHRIHLPNFGLCYSEFAIKLCTQCVFQLVLAVRHVVPRHSVEVLSSPYKEVICISLNSLRNYCSSISCIKFRSTRLMFKCFAETLKWCMNPLSDIGKADLCCKVLFRLQLPLYFLPVVIFFSCLLSIYTHQVQHLLKSWLVGTILNHVCGNLRLYISRLSGKYIMWKILRLDMPLLLCDCYILTWTWTSVDLLSFIKIIFKVR